jgi:hypothetical protein
MVEYDFAPGASLHEFEFRNRIDPRRPTARSPRLYDSLVGREFDMSSCDIPAEERESLAARASCMNFFYIIIIRMNHNLAEAILSFKSHRRRRRRVRRLNAQYVGLSHIHLRQDKNF